MRHNMLERLMAKGAIHAIGMGGGMGDDGGNKGGGRNGNNGDRSSGDSGGAKGNGKDSYGNRQAGGYKPSKGYHDAQQDKSRRDAQEKEMTRAIAKDFKSRHDDSYSKGSAVRGVERAREAMDRRTSTVQAEENAFSANRNMDAIAGLANPDSMTEAHKKDFSHATKAMTMSNKHAVADRHAADDTSTVNSVANAVGMLGGPAGVAATSVGTAMNTAHSKVNAMESLGVPQSAVDFGFETARGIVPGMAASQVAPIGAKLGASIAGVPGAVVGGMLTGYGANTAVSGAMNPANNSGAPSAPSNSVSDGSQVAASSISNARSALAPKQSAAQAPAFGVADMDLNNYSSGLLTARV